jgi:hypothetical protein
MPSQDKMVANIEVGFITVEKRKSGCHSDCARVRRRSSGSLPVPDAAARNGRCAGGRSVKLINGASGLAVHPDYPLAQLQQGHARIAAAY